MGAFPVLSQESLGFSFNICELSELKRAEAGLSGVATPAACDQLLGKEERWQLFHLALDLAENGGQWP